MPATTVTDLLRILRPSDRPDSEQYCGVRLSATRQPTGGPRWWMHCPRCDRRVGVLYQPRHADVACRVCHRLVYQSQRLSTAGRLTYRASKLLARIGCTRDDEYYWRPKGMHVRTFERIIAEAEAYDAAAVNAALSNWIQVQAFQ